MDSWDIDFSTFTLFLESSKELCPLQCGRSCITGRCFLTKHYAPQETLFNMYIVSVFVILKPAVTVTYGRKMSSKIISQQDLTNDYSQAEIKKERLCNHRISAIMIRLFILENVLYRLLVVRGAKEIQLQPFSLC